MRLNASIIARPYRYSLTYAFSTLLADLKILLVSFGDEFLTMIFYSRPRNMSRSVSLLPMITVRFCVIFNKF
jgi:hypothetical protein